ncbi:MAG: hypothetical protein WCO35_00260 [Candidatus Nomurabacteria bacterium]
MRVNISIFKESPINYIGVIYITGKKVCHYKLLINLPIEEIKVMLIPNTEESLLKLAVDLFQFTVLKDKEVIVIDEDLFLFLVGLIVDKVIELFDFENKLPVSGLKKISSLMIFSFEVDKIPESLFLH